MSRVMDGFRKAWATTCGHRAGMSLTAVRTSCTAERAILKRGTQYDTQPCEENLALWSCVGAYGLATVRPGLTFAVIMSSVRSTTLSSRRSADKYTEALQQLCTRALSLQLRWKRRYHDDFYICAKFENPKRFQSSCFNRFQKICQ